MTSDVYRGDCQLNVISAVRIVFFISNRIVIVDLTSSKYLLNKFNCFYSTALIWFLL